MGQVGSSISAVLWLISHPTTFVDVVECSDAVECSEEFFNEMRIEFCYKE